MVSLSKNGVLKNHKIHRLVALSFIPNPENKPMKLWIARDKYGLWLFEAKPYINNDMFTCDGGVYRIDSDLFPEVTFDNSPQEVELKLV